MIEKKRFLVDDIKNQKVKIEVGKCKRCGSDFRITMLDATICPLCSIEEKQRSEEIKKMTFKFMCHSLYFDKERDNFAFANFDEAWREAEKFYDKAKQKEKELNDA